MQIDLWTSFYLDVRPSAHAKYFIREQMMVKLLAPEFYI